VTDSKTVVEDLAGWSDRTRVWLAHISTSHPVEFATYLGAVLASSAVLLGTGRGVPDVIRSQIDSVITEVREEVCKGCKPTSMWI
jgi:hypothetical protein